MSSEPPMLDGAAVKSLLGAVAELLEVGGRRREIVIAGGSLLAWLDLRAATRDVDSVQKLDDEIKDAVATVALQRGLASNWLNDSAAPFWPRTLDLAECEVLMDAPSLCVRAVPLRYVVLMKLDRSAPADLDDIRRIWPFIDRAYSSAADLVEAYHAAFPLAGPDEHLAQFVVDQLAIGGFELPLRR